MTTALFHSTFLPLKAAIYVAREPAAVKRRRRVADASFFVRPQTNAASDSYRAVDVFPRTCLGQRPAGVPTHLFRTYAKVSTLLVADRASVVVYVTALLCSFRMAKFVLQLIVA